MKVSEFLALTKAKIDTPAKWLQGRTALDSRNIPVGSEDPRACKFCSVGAYESACEALRQSGKKQPRLNDQAPWHYLREATKTLSGVSGFGSPITFNDTKSHAEVMAMWDKAIELAKKDEA